MNTLKDQLRSMYSTTMFYINDATKLITTMTSNKMARNKAKRKLKEKKNLRVSDDATKEFVDLVDRKASELVEEIVKFTEHSGRSTIQVEDVKAVSSQ